MRQPTIRFTLELTPDMAEALEDALYKLAVANFDGYLEALRRIGVTGLQDRERREAAESRRETALSWLATMGRLNDLLSEREE